MGDYGIKVSKEGEDVKTATGGNILFTSSNKIFKVHAAGQVSITGGSDYTVSHNLGYSPAFEVWCEKSASSSDRVRLPRRVSPDPWSLVNGYAYTTTTNLVIITNVNCDAYYYIYEDSM